MPADLAYIRLRSLQALRMVVEEIEASDAADEVLMLTERLAVAIGYSCTAAEVRPRVLEVAAHLVDEALAYQRRIRISSTPKASG